MKYTFLTLLISSISFSQVGIGTTTPQETLHVNGTTRVQSLDNTNPLSNGVSTNVKADANGTLILENKTAANTLLINDTNILPFPVGLETNNQGNLVTSVIYSTTITVDYPRLVEFTSGISVNMYRRSNYSTITDGHARLVGCALLVNGNVRDEDREMYVNHDDSETIITGYLYLKNTTKMFLNAGVHTVDIRVFVLGGGRTYAEYGAAATDVLQVIQY